MVEEWRRIQQNPHTRFSLAAALKMIHVPKPQEKKIQHRLRHLAKVLQSRTDLTLRDDSRLAWAYATQTLPQTWTAETVADEIALTTYLHAYTHFTDTLKETVPLAQAEFETKLRNECPAIPPEEIESLAQFYTKSFIVPLLKLHCLFETHPDGKVPPPWPWQEKSTG